MSLSSPDTSAGARPEPAAARFRVLRGTAPKPTVSVPSNGASEPPSDTPPPPDAEAAIAAENAVTATTEVAVSPEIQAQRDRQAEKLSEATDRIIESRVARLGTELGDLQGKDRDEKIDELGLRTLCNLTEIMNAPVANYRNPDRPDGFDMSANNAKPTMVTIPEEGKPPELRQVTHILEGEDNVFVCSVQGSTEPYRIPREQLASAYAVDQREAIRPAFTEPAQQAVFDAFMDVAQNGQSAKVLDSPDAIDRMVIEAKKSFGEFTVDHLRQSINEKYADIPVPPGASTEQAQEIGRTNSRNETKRKEWEERLKGRTDVPYELFAEAMLGDLPQSVTASKDRVDRLKQALKQKGLNPDTRSQLEAQLIRADVHLDLQTKLQEMMRDPNAEKSLRSLFEQIQTGQFERGRDIVAAFTEGRLDDATELIDPSLKISAQDTAEQAIQKQHKKETYWKYGKGGGIGVLIALAAAGMAVKSAFGEER